MKIVITGGGSGGHVFPLLAVTDKVRELADKHHILQPKIYFFSDKKYAPEILFKQDIEFQKITAGKLRRGQGIKGFFLNIGSAFKMVYGILDVFIRFFYIMQM